jgi:hypothetical protein
MFRDFLSFFGMFWDVLGCFGRLVATESSPISKKQPKTQRKNPTVATFSRTYQTTFSETIRARLFFRKLLNGLGACF